MQYPEREMLTLAPLYRWRIWSSERLRNSQGRTLSDRRLLDSWPARPYSARGEHGPGATAACFHYFSAGRWLQGFPGGASGKEPTCQCRRHKRCEFDPWVGKIPWRRAWQTTPIFLPGESPWKEETGGLWSMGLERVRHDLSNLEHLQVWLHNSRTQPNWKCRAPCSKDWGKMSLKLLNRKVFLSPIVSLSTYHGVFNLLFNVVQSNKKLKY